jgi:hypothetical protein
MIALDSRAHKRTRISDMSAQVGAPIPPPGAPHPFSLADRERLAGLLSDAGLFRVVVTEVPSTVREDTVDDW